MVPYSVVQKFGHTFLPNGLIFIAFKLQINTKTLKEPIWKDAVTRTSGFMRASSRRTTALCHAANDICIYIYMHCKSTKIIKIIKIK